MEATVVLVDDHQIVREGIKNLLLEQKNLRVVAEAESGMEAIKLCLAHAPTLVIMDIDLPDMDGMQATKEILSHLPTTKILALSMYSELRYAAGMLRSGARGYVLKQGTFSELSDAIQTTLSGGIHLSPEISQIIVEDYIHHLPFIDKKKNVLTDREREVLILLAEGNSTREIAAQLELSGKTVDTHRKRIMNKLDLHSVAALTKYALQMGLISLQL